MPDEAALDILIVQSDIKLASMILKMLTANGHRVRIKQLSDTALNLLREEAFDLLIWDLHPRALGEAELRTWLNAHSPQTAVAFSPGAETRSSPSTPPGGHSFHYLRDPYDLTAISEIVDVVVTKQFTHPIDGSVIGVSSPILAVKRRLATLAASGASVLIHGETGQSGMSIVTQRLSLQLWAVQASPSSQSS